MKKVLLGLSFALLAMPAFAGYDIDLSNILDDVTTITPNSVDANDYVKVYSVTNTTTGYGTAQKIALQQLVDPVESLTAASTLTSASCGKTLMLNSATEFATTLPSPATGCKLKFIVKAAPASASYTIVTASSANILIGGINELEVDTGDDGPYDDDGDTITFVDGVSVKGDFVELISDGTSWYLYGQTKADGGATIAGS
ncbi:MAG: hypothetical protein PHD48_11980 [Alphaproteobacteria bacterium]|nr:hypothetical protein [Alphaproteobacteria bacterium]